MSSETNPQAGGIPATGWQLARRIYALTTPRGTAMPETALCDECMDLPVTATVLAAVVENFSGSNLVEYTGNDQLACQGCGYDGSEA